MAIYKYTLFKYLKSFSTWVIISISLIISIIIGGYLPFSQVDPSKHNAENDYVVTSIMVVAGVTSFLSIFSSVFAGFKGATMFKDEVEDGSFLIILSKPMKRSKIIFYKWLALQSIMLIYAFLTVSFYAIGTLIFDNGDQIASLHLLGAKTLSQSLGLVSVFMFAVLSLMGLIFSSIALLLSTKLSVGSTIGISIAIGVVIPITQLVGVFTKKPAYKIFTSNSPQMLLSEVNYLSKNYNIDNLKKDEQDIFNNSLKSIQDEVNKFHEFSKSPESIYGVGASTGKDDAYKYAFLFDFNFQIQKLAEYSFENAVPEIVKTAVLESQAQSYQNTPGLDVGTTAKTSDWEINGDAKKLGEMIQKTLSEMSQLRALMISASLMSMYDSLNKILGDDLSNERIKIDDSISKRFTEVDAPIHNTPEYNAYSSVVSELKASSDHRVSLRAIVDMYKTLFTTTLLSSATGSTSAQEIIDTMDADKQHNPNTILVNSHVVNKDKNLKWFDLFNLRFDDKIESYIKNKNAQEIFVTSKTSSPESPSQIINRNLFWFKHISYDAWFHVVDLISKTVINKDVYKSNPKNATPIAAFEINRKNIERMLNLIKDIMFNNKEIEKFKNENGVPVIAESMLESIPQYEMTRSDYETFRWAESIAASKAYTIAKIKHVPYTQKWHILIAYLVFAFGLVPISYIAVRKQDFK